jgi:ATP-dependent DNA ligase
MVSRCRYRRPRNSGPGGQDEKVWQLANVREGSLGALLLAYYDPDGRLVYAGRVGTGIKQAELERLWRRLQPLATAKMPLEVSPPRSSRFGSPLILSREMPHAKP